MTQTHSLIPFMHELADAAAAAILPRFRSPLVAEAKPGGRHAFDPVTAADREAEAAMRQLIGRRFPRHGIVGEEYGDERADAECVWLLDPIDGTRAFICGLPLWGVLIGFRCAGRPALGMIAQPYLGERFVGTGDEAWLERGGERRPLKVRPCPALAEASLSTTAPDLFDASEMARYRAVEGRARLVRYGADCYAYAMVAMGFLDCVVEAGLKPYDIEPIVPIVAGAGGFVTDWKGADKRGGGQVVAAGDRRVLEEALSELDR
ncbi:MAG TPA: histidinol-phosphatase [Afifellaceae bacterium]|nr:histidinol-phosphatase [Afifellaceae bacterium]